MPYYRRPWRRRRRIWRRRTRGPFRWRRRRRYWRNWVRKPKRKLKKITVKEWQPTKIVKLKITGEYPLFEGTNERTGNNNTQYIDAIAPHYMPGGGCFSITQFTLQGLYELHQKARNWWTRSNCNLPLIRYNGCTLRLYRSANADYVSVYARCGELKCTESLYQSCQPAILNLNKHKRLVKCSKDTKSKKPYKVMKIPPPTLMQSKWYFQKEIANTPLFILLTSAMSLNRWYIASTSISSTTGFYSLNTDSFQYRDFKKPSLTAGYVPNDTQHFFVLDKNINFEQARYKNLIYLGQSNTYTLGTPLQFVPPLNATQETQINQKVDTWLSNQDYWGNPFYPLYFSGDGPQILITNKFPQVKEKAKSTKLEGLIKTDSLFTFKTTPNVWECRYNPQNDRGHNTVYLQSITNTGKKWEAPENTMPKTEGLPLWLLLHGWLDYYDKLGRPQHMWTDYCLVIISDYITPKHSYYVLTDDDFLHGKSPYMPQEGMIADYDRLNWHPKLNFQRRSISKIINTGPGIVKLPPQISTEAHLHYTFHFKLGGCPPPMDDVCNPKEQPSFPRPGNILQTTLLQSPSTPIQYYLNSFDQRRDMLTRKASKRIKKDWGFTENIFEPTGTTSMDVPIETQTETSTSDTSEEEEEPQTLQLNLQRHRRKQRKLRLRILQLLKAAQKLE
nr:MAG: ORF1 [TTV-like mini virus]